MYTTKRTTSLLISFLFAGLLATGCQDKPSKEQLRAKATQQVAAANYADALIILRGLAQDEPRNAEVRLQLGNTLLAAGEPKEAEKELRRARELNIPLPQVLAPLLRSLLEQHAYELLIKETDALLHTGLLDAASMSYRAMAFLSLGQVEKAEESFKRAQQLDPKLAIAQLGSARMAFAKGETTESVKLVDQVLAEHPKDLEALAVKADMHEVLEQRQQAIEVYQRLVNTHPKHFNAHVRLVTLLIEERRFDEASSAIKNMQSSHPPLGTTEYLQALQLFKQNKLPEALNKIAVTLTEQPRYVPGLVLAGTIYFADNKLAEANKYLGQAVQIAPENLQPRLALARVLLRDNKPQQAFDTLRPAFQNAPDSPQLYALAGEALLHSNEPKLAREFLEYAEKLTPKGDAANAAAQAASAQAKALTQRVQRSLVISTFMGALNGQDNRQLPTSDQVNDPGQKYTLEILHSMRALNSGKFDVAERQLKQLLVARPNDPITNNLLGVALLQQRKTTAARESFETALKQQPDYYPTLQNLTVLDYQEGRAKEAQARFDAILARDPKNLSGLIGRATIAQFNNEGIENIASWLEKARQAHPQLLKPHLLLGNLYLRAGELGKAMEIAKAAQKISANDTEVLNLLGQTQTQIGDRNGAVTTYTQLSQARPNSIEPMVLLARAMHANGQSASAVQNLEKAISLQPQDIGLRGELVILLAKLGRRAEVIQQLEQLKKLKPSAALLSEIEGDIALAQGQYRPATENFEKAHKLEPTPSRLAKLNEALILQGKPDEAQARGLAWLEKNPKDLATAFTLAESASKMQRHPLAAAYYKHILKMRPNDLATLNNLANAYVPFDPAKALETAQIAYKLAPTNPNVMDTYGWAMIHAGKAREGLQMIDKASQIAPNSPEIAFHHATALVRTGDRIAGRIKLEQLLMKSPHFKEAPEAKLLLEQMRRDSAN